MKHLLTVALAFLLTQLAAQAAYISVVVKETPDRPAIILIKGRFMSNDAKRHISDFSSAAAIQRKPAIVFLDSQGGSVWMALQIGMAIKRYGF